MEEGRRCVGEEVCGGRGTEDGGGGADCADIRCLANKLSGGTER